MSSQSKRRKYEQRRRAELQDQTRRRIVEAAVELHETLGPARTSVVAIAEKAGVQRATVYRHFPDEQRMLAACSEHWIERNPPPDPAAWQGVEDPRKRLSTALDAFYGWYEHAEPMLSNVARDRPVLSALDDLNAGFDALLAMLADDLARGFEARGRRARRLRAAISFALDFTAWRALHLREVERRDCVALMTGMAAAALAPSAGSLPEAPPVG